ncbi:MAG: signal transduction histidine kinase [Myxococcota bacterium]|jgi:signal transduction histidine kinase
MRTRSRPSAALVLGVMSGALAAVTFLPTVIPVTQVIHEAEETVALREAQSASRSVSLGVRRGVEVTDRTRLDHGADLIHVVAKDGEQLYLEGGGFQADSYDTVCAQPANGMVMEDEQGTTWAVACTDSAKHRVVVAYRVAFRSPTQVLTLISLLALFVGIITAIGVLRLLSPLSEVSRALQRVGAGHRGVHIEGTGLAELDELVDRLNAAARAMEDREDAILARIQVVQELARLVAHEIRNPLQSLDFLASLMASEDSMEERRQLMLAIRAEIRALDMVVVRLLRDSASSGALKLHRTSQSLGPVVDQIMALNQPEASAQGTRLHVERVSQRPIPIDVALVSRSIENLVRNAIQAVAEQANGEVRVTVTEETDFLAVIVDDNGPGVDDFLAPQLFDAGVSGRQGGLGLGLSLVKGVVEAHDGNVEFGKSPAGGARFVARLPLAEAAEGDGVTVAA